MSQSTRDDLERCRKVLLRHLEELRPILNTLDLDDRAINMARDLVRTFVLSEAASATRGEIFIARSFNENGDPQLGSSAMDRPTYRAQFFDDNGQPLLTDDEEHLMSMVLILLLDFAQASLSRDRARAVRELCDAASDFVESMTGKPWTEPKSVVVKPRREQATHSDDFRSVNWFGKLHEFTALQAACVKFLWEAWSNGTPVIGNSTILEAVESNAERLGLVFRDHPAWGTMIVEGSTKGTHRLVEPPKL